MSMTARDLAVGPASVKNVLIDMEIFGNQKILC